MAPSLLTRPLWLSLTLLTAGAGGVQAAENALDAAGKGKPVGYSAPHGCRYPMGSGAARTLTCEGGVKLWRDDLKLQCEKLTALFDARGNITQATCVGAVQIVTAGGTAQGDRAKFDATGNQLELTGKPRATSRGNSVSADVIRMDLNTNELILERNVKGVLVPEPGMLPGGKAP